MNKPGEGPVYKKIQNYIFKFSQLLGQGNFSKVYRAHHEITNEVVAIKIVELESLKSKKLEELLYTEIDILKRLNHPNVLKCFEVFSSNRNCYIITELCSDGDLQSKLRKHRFMDERTANPLVADILEGLVYLAGKDIIHRDLKVANVFLSGGRAKIADFGFAKMTREKFKDINIGSPIYMSPEGFINNIYGPKSDVWAFGVLIYELLHGETPFSSCRTEKELKQALSVPISRKKMRHELTSEVKDAIMACLTIEEPKRPSMKEIVNLPYFRRIMGVDQPKLPPQLNPAVTGSAFDLRMNRSPSNYAQNTMLTSDQGEIRRKVSVDRVMGDQAPRALQKQHSESAKKTTFLANAHQFPKNSRPLDSKDSSLQRDRRAVSTEKLTFFTNTLQREGRLERSNHSSKKGSQARNRFEILISRLSFKECVNVLHYGRLIFKFLLTLKHSEFSNDGQLRRLTRWLLQLLGEIEQKIENKDVVYEGDNASLREQKLREVRSEYEKKYRAELGQFARGAFSFGEPLETLDIMASYCNNLFQKYDSLITTAADRPLLMLGHCLALMCETNLLLMRCHKERGYGPLLTHRDIEAFLNQPKESIDHNSYLRARSKATPA